MNKGETMPKRTRFGAMRTALRGIVSGRAPFLARVKSFIRFVRLCWSDNEKIGSMLGVPKDVSRAWGQLVNASAYDPETELGLESVKNPVRNQAISFAEAVRAGADHSKLSEDNPFKGKKIEVEEAWIYEAHYDQDGRVVREAKVLESLNRGWPLHYRVRRVTGTEAFVAALNAAESAMTKAGERTAAARGVREAKTAAARRLMREGWLDSFDGTGADTTNYDPNQYTEFAPLMGGPFSKQLYLHDYLKQHAYAFEAWNHNPLAKRIVTLLSQYTLGRRFTLRIKNANQQKAWDEAEKRNKIVDKISEFWANEANIYGELMVQKSRWLSIDPSTVWDIITNPENVDERYYYYQSYSTQYQTFTGYRIKGEPGSEQQPSQKYVVRQIPANDVLHMKLNCVSVEKRGRSILFPVLGWLKRVKDLYNAQVISEWLQSMFTWDVTVDGNQDDVDAYTAAWNAIPTPGSTHVHNKAVERKPMSASEGSGSRGGGRGASIADHLLAFIATAIGAPKEFFNVSSMGGGSRVQALTSAEPFTKMIEDLQAKWESFIKDIFESVMEQEGLDYKPGDVEVLFPSVTKDTTTETIKNLATGESMGWIRKRTAAEMYAKEMNITEFDFEEEQKGIADDEKKGLNRTGATPLPPAGRFGGQPSANGADAGGQDNHGQGKVDLLADMNDL